MRDNEYGGVALWAALVVPVVALMSLGAADLARAASERSKLQDAADAAVLAVAKEMGTGGTTGAEERAEALVLSSLRHVLPESELAAEAVVIDRGAALRLTVSSVRPSLMQINEGVFKTSATSVAARANIRTVCVLALNTDGEAISVEDDSSVEAPGCGVRSNDNIEVQRDARLTAADVQISGIKKGSGPILPAGQTSAPQSSDPFAGKAVDFPATCMTSVKKDVKVEKLMVQTLQPGVHRGNVEVSDTAFLTLAPGVHWFCDGDLVAKNYATLRGDGVTLMFHRTSKLKFDNDARVDLIGGKSGSWAGFLIVAARDNTDNFEVKSVYARRLEGVVYLPAATLKVDTTLYGNVAVEGDISDAAKWTVAVVDELVVKGAPHLYINDDYVSSGVPLPGALKQSGMRLLE